ncbi:LOB domain-containing protein 1-like [Andrographis paniculata]|uniref:LOB domain-containing protein 1-like n=1 Tax=Andrographis paniculata TaxID=175694 RepID=UPI0021E95DD8|nr:LOB domain-containing protein 1-like [Andrographis paniculata]
MGSYAAAGKSSKGCFSWSPTAVLSPCAACKILRRRCVEKCVLAPYFPPTDPLKFSIAHRVFGASNIIKFLQEVPVDQRSDTVNSMVYEASARLRDPVYGSAGAISNLQKQIGELQAELAKANAEILNMQCLNAYLFDQISKRDSPRNTKFHQQQDEEDDDNDSTFPLQICDTLITPSFYNGEETNLGFSWDPLWT